MCEANTVAFIAQAFVALMPSNPMQSPSSGQSRTPQVKAPCAPTRRVETPADMTGISDPTLCVVSGTRTFPVAVAWFSSLIVLGERRRHRGTHGHNVAHQHETALAVSEPRRQHAVVDFTGDRKAVESGGR